jgi:hypothetical protein
MRRAISGKRRLPKILHVSWIILYSRLFCFAFALKLNQQAFAQIARADARRIKALDEREHVLEIVLRDAGIERHLFRRRLQKAVVVDVADDQLGGFAIVRVQGGLVELTHQMLLQRFLRRDGIEKELALFFVFLGRGRCSCRTAPCNRAIRHRAWPADRTLP